LTGDLRLGSDGFDAGLGAEWFKPSLSQVRLAHHVHLCLGPCRGVDRDPLPCGSCFRYEAKNGANMTQSIGIAAKKDADHQKQVQKALCTRCGAMPASLQPPTKSTLYLLEKFIQPKARPHRCPTGNQNPIIEIGSNMHG